MKRRVIMTGILALMLLSASAQGAQKSTTAVREQPVAASKKATPAKPAATRTLDAIRIEGEIDVPQVLFITARDYRRFRDRTPAAYQITSADVAKTIPHPNRVRMVAPVE